MYVKDGSKDVYGTGQRTVTLYSIFSTRKNGQTLTLATSEHKQAGKTTSWNQLFRL